MPKAKITPSGNYNVKVVDHYEWIGGKRKIKFRSFTASTKAECEALAAEFQLNKSDSKKANITVAQAVDRYIVSRETVLAPYTIRGYRSIERNAFALIGEKRLRALRSEDVQAWISAYKVGRSPKSVRNAYSLLIASVAMFRPSAKFAVTLPQKRPPELYTPTDEDVRKLLDHIKGTELEKAVLLSAIGTLRRGEVCGITYDDIHGDEIRINKELVMDHGKWVFKAPKTPESIRTVKYPHKVIKRLLRDPNASGRVVDLLPDTITNQHRKRLEEIGIPLFRFHDLRAYAISIRHAIGIPDVYIMADSGHKSDVIMKQIYRRAMSDKRKEFAKITTKHFSSVLAGKKVNKKVNNVSKKR